jgi:hypothetical protein
MLAVALTLAIEFGGSLLIDFASRLGFGPDVLMSEWPWETIAVTSTALVFVAIRRLRRQALL